jgi:hypothetical protein
MNYLVVIVYHDQLQTRQNARHKEAPYNQGIDSVSIILGRYGTPAIKTYRNNCRVSMRRSGFTDTRGLLVM